MCGIAGFVGNDPATLERMLDSIVHRGPNGSGADTRAPFSVGMRRLAIIDPQHGQQPIYNAAGTISIVLNGEIYNYKELWQELQQKGYRFTTDHSDTEAVLHAYQEWGRDCVHHLIGMFAFAIHDGERGELFIARDRLGIKPLYYTSRPRFAFASEFKALFQDPSVPRQPNRDSVRQYLLYRVHDATEDTFFEGIKRLLPGHHMVVKADGTYAITRYWKPEVSPDFSSARSDDSYAEEFYDLYKKVIRRHLISDVPVGVTLSGGLDSSGVASVTAELIKQGSQVHTGNQLHTFSALFPGQTIDESEYIHLMERHTNSVPHYSHPDVETFWRELDQWMWTQEEPTISSAPYAYYSVYREVAKHVRVALSGNGGDELLAGYLPYFKAYFTSAWDQNHYGALVREIVRGFRVYQGVVRTALAERNRLRGNPISMRGLVTPEIAQVKRHDYRPSRNLNERLAQDVTKYSTPNLLRYEDKNSMAFSVESRVPFLDHELVEYIFRLPIDQKIKRGWTRFVYRNAMRDHMPEPIRTRRSKVGFTNPELDWLRAKHKEISLIFSSSVFARRGLYQKGSVDRAWNEWLAGRPGDGLIFWRILCTELWMRRFIDQPVLLG
ncbi:MAG: asparagine synthase (glutamine-hydrolyzing) [bacterium]|nr:asparagine synthase (glutamine-hydrolyzing) [bacterium]